MIVVINALAFSFLSIQTVSAVLFHIKQKNSHCGAPFRKEFLWSVYDTISVIIPYFNENDSSVQATVDSVASQYPDVRLEIILVSDGNLRPAQITHPKHVNVKHVVLQRNQGKRQALLEGFKESYGGYIAVVDSDTTLAPRALYRLYKSMAVNDTAAVCGSIQIRNRNENLLTRVISAMYWFAFNFERASQSFFGTQMICSGALSLYRRDAFAKAIAELPKQHIGSLKCMAGDDRHLTTQIMLQGLKTGFAPDAIAYTDTPSTIKSFGRQQLRWSRSFVSELLWSAPRFKQLPSMYTFFMLKSVFRVVYLLFFIWALIFHFQITAFFFAIIFVKAIIIAYCTKRPFDTLYTIIMAVLGYVLLAPIMLWGVVTYRKSGWLTR